MNVSTTGLSITLAVCLIDLQSSISGAKRTDSIRHSGREDFGSMAHEKSTCLSRRDAHHVKKRKKRREQIKFFKQSSSGPNVLRLGAVSSGLETEG